MTMCKATQLLSTLAKDEDGLLPLVINLALRRGQCRARTACDRTCIGRHACKLVLMRQAGSMYNIALVLMMPDQKAT